MNDLELLVDQILLPRDFTFKKHAWYRSRDQLKQIIGLEKSTFGDAYQFRFGVTSTYLDKREFPPISELSLEWSKGHRMNGKEIARLLEATNPKSPVILQERTKIVLGFFDRIVFPIFEGVFDTHSLREAAFDEQSSYFSLLSRFTESELPAE